MKLIEKIKNFKWGYISIALITAIISICFFVFNNDSLNALAITIGIVIILMAIILAFLTLASKARGFLFGVKIALSVAMLVTGVVAIVARDTTVNVMVGIFGLMMIIDGSLKFNTAAMSKRYKLWCWIVMLVLSVLLIGGGYFTVRLLTIENDATVYVLGALFMLDAIANFFSAFYLSAGEKRVESEIREKILKEQNPLDAEDNEEKAEEDEDAPLGDEDAPLEDEDADSSAE